MLHLLGIPEDGPAGHTERVELLSPISESRSRKHGLPSYEDMQRRDSHGAAFRAGATGEYLTYWLDDRRRAGDLEETTLNEYRTHVARMLPSFDQVPLDKRTRDDARALHPSFVTARFQRLAFDAGLPPIREHDARHGAASLAHAGGADIMAIKNMLRHSTIVITADTYTSVFDETDRSVAVAAVAVVPRKVAVGEPSETDVPRSFPASNPMGLRSIT